MTERLVAVSRRGNARADLRGALADADYSNVLRQCREEWLATWGEPYSADWAKLIGVSENGLEAVWQEEQKAKRLYKDLRDVLRRLVDFAANHEVGTAGAKAHVLYMLSGALGADRLVDALSAEPIRDAANWRRPGRAHWLSVSGLCAPEPYALGRSLTVRELAIASLLAGWRPEVRGTAAGRAAKVTVAFIIDVETRLIAKALREATKRANPK